MSDTNSANDRFSFVEAEHEVLTLWRDKNIFQRSLEATRDCPPYVFYDGPPFATGLPHHGHLLASTIKDIAPRYFTMKGRYVERRFGWDCHGLPIEHEIDKKLGKSAQEAVAELGIKGYNDECRAIVDRYVNEWERTISRIGRWVDFENDYKTMDAPFMESVWWAFSQLWEKGLVYEGTRVVPFSTALGTVLSNFEANLNYQDVQDPSVTVLFKLADEDTHIAAWTTTPWTLPSNLALCVGEDIDYVKVRDGERDEIIILAEDCLPTYSKKRELEVLERFKGSELKGRRYRPLFNFFADLEKDGCFTILADDYVNTDAGTGIVHMAPAFGEDDNRVMKAAGIEAMVVPVNDAGKFTAEVPDYQGQHVKQADKAIMRDLKASGQLYQQDVIVHSYPFCYRSDTPLIYRAIPSWYVNVETIKHKLLAANDQIRWVPEHIKHGRFGKWLEGARDWAISRNRIWGTPIPIWRNDASGKTLCIGSVEELERYSGVRVDDLHREYVDEVTFTIEGEAGTYKRIPEVFDCWFESGSMPYAQKHYPFENREAFEQGFPAEFIAEGLDQTRGWFYTLTILAAALFDKPAFRNVIVNGIVMAEDGKKMSKRLKNYTPPDQLMETYGADALRLYLINSGLVRAEEQRFSDEGVKDMVRRALLPWYNAFKFFATYAEVDGWNVREHFERGENITDNWLLSNLQTLKKTISQEMEAYRLYNVVPGLFRFIEDLTNWYIRLNRQRFWAEGLEADKRAAYSTLYTAISELSTAMAPFAPFLAEHIYQQLLAFDPQREQAPESVHLCRYPEADESLIEPELERAVDRMQQLILLGRQKRNQVQIKTKTPLSCLTIIHKEQPLLDEIARLEDYIRAELNVKQIRYDNDEARYIDLYAKPNLKVLGKRLGKQMKAFKQAIEALDGEALQQFEEQGEIIIEGERFAGEDILLFREAKPGTEAVSNRYISIDLNCQLNDALIAEGLAREVVNRIQKSRKDANLNVDDRIRLRLHAEPALRVAIEAHRDYIQSETLATEMELADQPQPREMPAVEGHTLSLWLEKVA